MPLINRKAKDKAIDADGGQTQQEKVKWSKRPASEQGGLPARNALIKIADTAFKQQRLKAWQPILTPKAVLPTLFLIGLIFAPIGALIVWGSGKVTTITLDYTDCNTSGGTGGAFESMPSQKYSCALRKHGGPSSAEGSAQMLCQPDPPCPHQAFQLPPGHSAMILQGV